MRSSIYIPCDPSHHAVPPHSRFHALNISQKIYLWGGWGVHLSQRQGLSGYGVDHRPCCFVCHFIVIFGIPLDLSDVGFLP